MKKVFVYIYFYFILITGNTQLASEVKTTTSFPLSNAIIYVDDADDTLVKRSAAAGNKKMKLEVLIFLKL